MSEWIENKGNDCPVPAGVRIEINFGDGDVIAIGNPEMWSWIRFDGDITDEDVAGGIIVAYRVIDKP